MAEDVDFVTVGGAWFHGRADFDKYHTRLLAGRFRDSTNTPLETNCALPCPRRGRRALLTIRLSQRPRCGATSVRFPRHPAVAYLYLVKYSDHRASLRILGKIRVAVTTAARESL